MSFHDDETAGSRPRNRSGRAERGRPHTRNRFQPLQQFPVQAGQLLTVIPASGRVERHQKQVVALEPEVVPKLGEVLEKLATDEEEILTIRNFGRKSLEELKEKLRAKGFLSEGAEVEEEVPA